MQREPRIKDAVLERVVTRDRGLARELEEMHADEDGDKAYDEGQGVHRGIGVEALEENEGCNDSGRREADVVKRVHSG